MGNCPRCGLQTQKISNTIICKCGWTLSQKEEVSQGGVILGMMLFFVLTAGVLFHFFQWGAHGFRIIFANASDKVEICMDLNKYDCVEKNYRTLFKKTGDAKYLEQLGELEFKREKFDSAIETYTVYFNKEGRNYKSAYYYAHSLAKAGDIESAIQYFDSILQSDPGLLMVTVVESYLEILVSNNRIQKAREILAWVNQKNKGSVSTSDQIEAWQKKYNI